MQPKYQLTDPYAGATRYFDDSQPAGAGYKPTVADYITDSGKQSYASGLLDMVNRGLIAGTAGAPVDIANTLIGTRWPELQSEKPFMGSEWIGQKMQDYGLVSPVRRPIGEAVAGFADPETLGLAAAKLAALGKVAGAGHSLAMLPGFFSKLERGLAAAPEQALTTGNAIKQWLSGNAGKYGIKQAEIEATGLGAHLENLGKGKTSKEELLNVVKAGDPGVVESVNTSPKYSQYVLPGGENYREMLLTLPSDEMSMAAKNLENEIATQQEIIRQTFSYTEKYPETAQRQYSIRENAIKKLNTAIEELKAIKNKPPELKSPNFKSPHWDEPNVLAHIRTNDRVGPNGEKQLFVEELQSDWAQKGRKEGFTGDVNLKVVTENGRKKLVDSAGNVVDAQYGDRFKSDQEYIDAFIDAYKNSQGSTIPAVPRAPYVTNTKDWTELGIKRIMQHAAENGYDQVAFINGAQSADRYNLSKHFDSIVLHDNTSGGVGLAKMEGPFTHGTVTAYNPNNEKVIDNHYVSSPDELANLIGQELAEKLLNTAPKSARSDSGFGVRQRKLSGLDLQVGGEGMKKFYDEIVPQAAGKFAKQYGAPFGVKPMETGNQFTIDITPSMRQNITEKGMPAFAKGGSVEDFKDFAKDWYERRQWRGLGLGSIYGRDEMEKRLDSEVPYEKMKVIDNNPGIKAQYVPGAFSDKIQITPNVKPEEVAHEWNHLARKYALGAKLNDYAVAHLPGTVKSSEDYLFDASDKKLHHKLRSFNSAMGMYDEISDPEEIQTRLMRMRYAAGFQPDKDVTKEDLQNFYKNYNGKDFQINQLLDIAPNDDAMLRLLNLMSNNQKPSDDTVYAAEGGLVNTDDDDYGQPFGDEIAKLYQGGLYRKGGEVHKYIVTSLTPVQKRLLKAHHAELGDESSFDDWMSDAGIPAIIHGHATKSMDSFLTPEQREMLDQVNS